MSLYASTEALWSVDQPSHSMACKTGELCSPTFLSTISAYERELHVDFEKIGGYFCKIARVHGTGSAAIAVVSEEERPVIIDPICLLHLFRNSTVFQLTWTERKDEVTSTWLLPVSV